MRELKKFSGERISILKVTEVFESRLLGAGAGMG